MLRIWSGHKTRDTDPISSSEGQIRSRKVPPPPTHTQLTGRAGEITGMARDCVGGERSGHWITRGSHVNWVKGEARVALGSRNWFSLTEAHSGWCAADEIHVLRWDELLGRRCQFTCNTYRLVNGWGANQNRQKYNSPGLTCDGKK